MSTGTTELLGHEEDSAQETGLVAGQQVTARSPLQLFWRRFRKDKVAMVAAGFVVLACLVAILAPVIVKVTGAPDPNVQNPNLLDESPIEPQTEANQPNMGTKLFVLFFFLIVPPLGVALLVALCWTMWKAFNA